MTKQKSTKRALLLSALSLLMCVSMLIGSTFAWFTDSVTSGINKIVAGNLDVELYHSDKAATDEQVGDATKLFDDVTLWEPGAMVWEKLTVKNLGSLALKYTLTVNVSDVSVVNGKSLADVLKVAVMDVQPTRENIVTAEKKDLESFVLKSDCELEAKNGVDDFYIAIYWAPSANDNDYNVAGEKLYANLGLTLVATQATVESDSFDDQYDKDAEYPKFTDTWDGTADTSWYNDNDTEFILTTAEQLAGLAELVDGGNTFAGKTVKLGTDIDLYHLADGATDPTCFDPIGSYRKDLIFEGILDGQGHTIANMNQNTWALNNGYYYGDLGLGLFGAVENATIKNLVMDNASISGESALCGTVAAVAGDNVTFENITVKNSDVADYQYYAGGIVGWAGGDEQFINCVIDASTTIGAQWGEFNNANGGVIGGASTSADILMKNCTVACRIDAFNDVTSAYEWYSYRRSGMLIGDSGQVDDPNGDNVGNAIAPNLTCENVTVIYGDWANYHYCQFNAMGYPWVRVEAGTSTGAYSNPRYGHPTDANGNEVVDENHTHNDGEKHNELIVFDQLYGGKTGDRYCTYGTATHAGVNVIYNNK